MTSGLETTVARLEQVFQSLLATKTKENAPALDMLMKEITAVRELASKSKQKDAEQPGSPAPSATTPNPAETPQASIRSQKPVWDVPVMEASLNIRSIIRRFEGCYEVNKDSITPDEINAYFCSA